MKEMKEAQMEEIKQLEINSADLKKQKKKVDSGQNEEIKGSQRSDEVI